MIPPGMVLQKGVVSDLGGTVAPDAIILTNAEKTADYAVLNLASGGRGNDGVRKTGGAVVLAAAAREAAERGVRHRRDWEEVDEHGFRRWEGEGTEWHRTAERLVCQVDI